MVLLLVVVQENRRCLVAIDFVCPKESKMNFISAILEGTGTELGQ